jgi:hypothetical protein
MKMDKSTISQFRDDFAEAVKTLELKYQVKITLPNISYNEAGLTTKMSVDNITDSGEKLVDPRVLAYKNLEARAALQGKFPLSDSEPVIGKNVALKSGIKGVIIDFDRKKFKYPFIVKTVEGIMYKITPEQIATLA